MAVDIFSAFLSYATIPLYVVGLLILVYAIARTQLGISLSEEAREAAKNELVPDAPGYSASTYLVAAALLVLVMVAIIMDQKR